MGQPPFKVAVLLNQLEACRSSAGNIAGLSLSRRNEAVAAAVPPDGRRLGQKH
jgi:hypothetical protein